jgi:large subunit ribosomal protein L15
MITLNTLKNASRPYKKNKRVGRGPGSGLGKTCGRGEKGAGSRSGYTRRLGYEGGQFRTYMKLPVRGFNNNAFKKTYETINLGQISNIFNDGDIVSLETLLQKGYLNGRPGPLKILGDGTLTKNVRIHANAVSESAREKLVQDKVEFNLSAK